MADMQEGWQRELAELRAKAEALETELEAESKALRAEIETLRQRTVEMARCLVSRA